MANHSKAQKHLKAAHDASKAGNAKLAQSHAFHAVKALASVPSSQPEPDDDEMGGPPDNDQDDTPPQSSSKNFIQGAIKHPGALHRDLGVPQGQPIPAKKIQQAANSPDPTLARRARLAQTLKTLSHKGR